MSVTHLDSVEGTRGAEGSRKPPQDIPAEQSVLGGMMLSKDAIADVVETLRGSDFYRPAHETVFEAVLDLYGRGEPADGNLARRAPPGDLPLARVSAGSGSL